MLATVTVHAYVHIRIFKLAKAGGHVVVALVTRIFNTKTLGLTWRCRTFSLFVKGLRTPSIKETGKQITVEHVAGSISVSVHTNLALGTVQDA